MKLSAVLTLGLASLVLALGTVTPVNADEPTTGTISGHVDLQGSKTDPEGALHPAVGVVVDLDKRQGTLPLPYFETYAAVTDAAGNFSRAGLPPGEYRIHFDPVEFNFVETYAGGASADAATVYQLQPGGSMGVSQVLNVGGSISGMMHLEDGELIDGSAGLWTVGAKDDNSTLAMLMVSGGGLYRAGQLPLGTYRLGFSMTTYPVDNQGELRVNWSGSGYYEQWYPSQAAYAASSTITISRPGQVIDGLDVYFQPKPITGPPPALPSVITDYVALGDSYQSGEGAYSYIDGTDDSNNKCHRSYEAYPEELLRRGEVFSGLGFWACSGSLIEDLYQDTVTFDAPVYTDPLWADSSSGPVSGGPRLSALERLSGGTDLITVGIGGNDMQFVPVLNACVTMMILGSTCEPVQGPILDQRLHDMVAGDKWGHLFDDIRLHAPNARVMVLGYPRFYQNTLDTPSFCTLGTGVGKSDQIWINSVIRKLNAAIAEAAASRGFQYVDIYDLPDGRELCSGADEPFLNPVILLNDAEIPASESYHPTASGHDAIADVVGAAMHMAGPGTSLVLHQGQTTEFRRDVDAGTALLELSIDWPGSTVSTTLISPSGRVISGADAGVDVRHTVNAVSETFAIDDPEPGRWSIRLYGQDLAPDGEQVTLTQITQEAANVAPTASIALIAAGSTVDVDASASTDSDGEIDSFMWDFGDGEIANGATATHTYAQPGSYSVSLVVSDDDGDQGFATADSRVDVVGSDSIAFISERHGGRHVYLSDVDGAVTQLTSGAGIDSDPDVSPDGTRVVFASSRTGNGDIYVVNTDGSGLLRLTSGSAIDTAPSWSPDGTQIVFASSRTGLGDLYLMNADGSSLRRLTKTTAVDTDPEWSPDSTHIAFTSVSGLNTDVYTVLADATGRLRITTSATIDGQPTWSPDGTRLAFSSTRSGLGDIYVADATGGAAHRVTTGIAIDFDPAWTADDTILFTSATVAGVDVYQVSVDGSGRTAVLSGHGYDGEASK